MTQITETESRGSSHYQELSVTDVFKEENFKSNKLYITVSAVALRHKRPLDATLVLSASAQITFGERPQVTQIKL